MEDNKDSSLVNNAVKLSVIEVFLGSILHALRVPLSGQFLSLNQGFLLGRFLDKEASRAEAFKSSFEISLITSTMKALSPAGKKLGPMISISMQGFLYGIGLLVLGKGLLGQILGMMLLSLWAFIQPLITYYLMYGSELVGAIAYYLKKLQKHVPVTEETLFFVVAFMIGTKWLLAISIPVLSRKIDFKKYEDKMQSLAKDKGAKPIKPSKSTFQGVVHDLTRPLFLLSLILMGAYFFTTGKDLGFVMWKILRALSIAFLIFFLARSTFFQRLIAKWAERSVFMKRISTLSGQAVVKLREMA